MDKHSNAMIGVRATISSMAKLVGAAGIALGAAVPLAAQTVTVTLEPDNGGPSVSGRLLIADENRLVVATQSGEVNLDPSAVTCSGRACPMLEPLPEQTVPAQMRRIELSSLDKTIAVEGQLRGLTEDRLIVEVPELGLVSLRHRGLRCSGPGCRVTLAMLAPPVAAPPPKPNVAPLQIVGDQDLIDGLLAPLLRGFATQRASQGEMRRRSDSTYLLSLEKSAGDFFVGTTNPSAAFGALAAGAADFAITARQPNSGEVAALVAAGLGDLRGTGSESVLAVGGLSIITHPSLGLPELSFAQIAGIYRGEITNWSAVGGPDQPITVFAREPGSAERAVFQRAVLDPSSTVRGAHIVGSTAEMVDKLGATPNSVGYAWDVFGEGLGRINLAGHCSIQNQNDHFAHHSGDNALSARFYLYANPKAQSQVAQAFAQYAQSAAAELVLAGSRFGDRGITQRSLAEMPAYVRPMPEGGDLQVPLAARLLAEADKWDRLSVTYRSEGDGGELRLPGNRDEARLLSYLERMPQVPQIGVIGFGGAGVDFASTMDASMTDAALVADHLALAGKSQLAGKTVVSAGYGDLAHMACADSPNAARLNRRVEIWVPAAE